MSEKPYSIRFNDEECDKILECEKILGLRFSDAVRAIVDAYEPEYELKKEKKRTEEKLKYINEKLETIEQDKMIEVEQEEFNEIESEKKEQEQKQTETEAQKQLQPIWNKLVDKFTQDPDDISFKGKDKEKIDKFIENKTKDLDTKLKENIEKRLKKTVERYIVKEVENK